MAMRLGGERRVMHRRRWLHALRCIATARTRPAAGGPSHRRFVQLHGGLSAAAETTELQSAGPRYGTNVRALRDSCGSVSGSTSADLIGQ